MAGVQYPGAYNDFLAVIDVVNLDLGFILTFACIYNTHFYDRLLMATLGPMVVLSVLGCSYLVARRRNRHSQEASRLSEAKRPKWEVPRNRSNRPGSLIVVCYGVSSVTVGRSTFPCPAVPPRPTHTLFARRRP